MDQRTQFALINAPAPVFNTEDLSSWFGGAGGDSLRLDDQNLLRCIEIVLLPGSKVEILSSATPPFWKIRTREYPFEQSYYVHEQFLDFQTEEPPERTPRLADVDSILAQCKSLLGARYIWGGNWPPGIPSLSHLHPPRSSFENLSTETREMWTLKGVDCSGLLYFLTDGYTPRQTSSLIHFGQGIPIEGMSIDAIARGLKPLDIIVWRGHVLVAIDQDTLIESINPKGVVAVDSRERLAEIREKKEAINDSLLCSENHFVIRRWHPQFA